MREKKPPLYRKLAKQHPSFVAAIEALGETVRTTGPLDAKTVHLVQLAAAAAIRSEGATHSHARRAVQAGATAEEIRHALIALTATIGFPTVTAALSWVEDVLEPKRSSTRTQ